MVFRFSFTNRRNSKNERKVVLLFFLKMGTDASIIQYIPTSLKKEIIKINFCV